MGAYEVACPHNSSYMELCTFYISIGKLERTPHAKKCRGQRMIFSRTSKGSISTPVDTGHILEASLAIADDFVHCGSKIMMDRGSTYPHGQCTYLKSRLFLFVLSIG